MFRKSEKSDCQYIYNLVCDMENKKLPYDTFTKIYLEQINRQDMFCLVALVDDIVVGFLNMRFEKQLHHCSYIAEIMEFVVDKNVRNRGIGQELFQNSCQIAFNYGCSQIEVACNQLRTKTHEFYKNQQMQNYHYKFSKSLISKNDTENKLGR